MRSWLLPLCTSFLGLVTSQPGGGPIGMGGMPGMGGMGMPQMGGMGGMNMAGMGGGGGGMPGRPPPGSMPAMNSIPGMPGMAADTHTNPDYGGGPPGGMPPGGMPPGGMPPGGMPPGGMPGGGGGPMGGMGLPMGGDQGMGGQGRGGSPMNRAGPAMAGAMGQGGRGEYGVIQSAGPAMEAGHEEDAPLERHDTQIIYKVDGELQKIDDGIQTARKRGGHVQLELNEGTHTIRNTLKVGAQGDNWKGVVVNFHDLKIVGQGIGKTTIYGGIKTYQSESVIIQDLTVTAPLNGSAFWIEGEHVTLERVEIIGSSQDGMTIQEGTVTLIDVEIHQNKRRGLFVCGYETKLIANNLHVHHNIFHGLDVVAGAKVKIYGKDSSFHDNGIHGVVVEFHSHVEVYLEEQHNTFQDNIGDETSVEEGSSLKYLGYQEL